ncbi:hypothetical protein THAOC_24797, partial [Thalassiosira oceanica]
MSNGNVGIGSGLCKGCPASASPKGNGRSPRFQEPRLHEHIAMLQVTDATINSLDGNSMIRRGKERKHLQIEQPETKTGGAMRRRDLDG